MFFAVSASSLADGVPGRARFVQNGQLQMTRREGSERAAAVRLTSGIYPETARLVLERCLSGDLPPSLALRELFEMMAQPEHVRSLVDQVTNRAAVLSRAGDRLLQDRVDELTQLVVEPDTTH